ncbi:MAG: polyhydroxyalkanoate depolymerase [Beijerinckiaceae bacterium]
MNRGMYYFYESAHAMMAPARAMSDAVRLFYRNPSNPISHTPAGRSMAASAEMFERATRRYGKPIFDLPRTVVDGEEVAVMERVVWRKTFCNLVHFDRALPPRTASQPKVLIVAPMSGHYATLLRGTVEAFLPDHEVFITDWADARMVPLADGRFDLDDYIDYMIEIFAYLGPDVHVMAVCQPSVPVAAAVALLEAKDSAFVPRSMTLMGGPIDTRESPTAVNRVAKERGMAWFKKNCTYKVPFTSLGFGREVYPGFLQLSGFMAMNIDKHMNAHWDMYSNLVRGDGDSVDKHQDFYDEYMAVMDLTAEFYLQTVDEVFVKHSLAKGELMHRGTAVDLAAVRRCALMTVEGENDDISGVGQTKATHALCVNLPKEKQLYHLQPDVGHYGVFNGSRFRRDIAPAIKGFMAAQSAPAVKAKAKPALKVVQQAAE